MVDACAASTRLRSPRHRVYFPHASPIDDRNRLTGRCRFSGLKTWRVGETVVNISWQMSSLLLLGGSTVLLFVGMPVAISFIAINLIGAVLFLGGDPGLHYIASNNVAAAIQFSFSPVPPLTLFC